ncbi:MAG: tetratricopeptide repeat protein [Planctomycetota bacterium]|nr:tetratricopeptide repeat protein [Planctomycetota bacterium]
MMDDPRSTPRLYHGIFWIGVIACAGMVLGGLYHAYTSQGRPPAIALSYPDNIEAKFQGQQFEEAAAQLRTALMIESGGTFPESQIELSLGNALASRNAIPQAIEHFQRAVRMDPDLAEGHYALGVAILQQGDAQAAERSIQAAMELDADYKAAFAGVCNTLAVTEYRAGHFQAARDHITRALELDGNYAEAENNAGLIYMQLGQPDRALEHLKEALRIKPDFQAARRHHDEAMRQLERK